MTFAISIFEGFDDLSGTYSVADITMAMVLSGALAIIIGLTYRATHRGVSYSQTFVQTLVMMSMVVSLVMLIVGSNLARAFSLVGALSIVRFRNAVKETRDVGFIFLAMAVGMATGTRFYSLAGVGTVVICGAIVLMTRMDLFRLNLSSQIVKVQLPPGTDPALLNDVFLQMTQQANLVSIESIRGGALSEYMYSVRLKNSVDPSALLNALQARTGGQKVTVLTGYDQTDL